MRLKEVLASSFIFVAFFENAFSWSGNFCTKVSSSFRDQSYCKCWFFGWCSHWEDVRRIFYYTENYCCPGWRQNGNQNCNIAVCSPSCQNGGTCIRPNVCACSVGYAGDICSGFATCSHLHPCYPGRCYGSNMCMCSDGFVGSTCKTLQSNEFKPLIEKGNATFAMFRNISKQFDYEFMTDGTNKSDVDQIWTNLEEFNLMKFDIDASIYVQYKFDHIPPLPTYIRNMKFGIVDAFALVVHLKLDKGVETEVSRDTFACPQPSNDNPIANAVLECRMNNGTNVFQVDSGDRYVLTFTVTTGGYRELVNTDNNQLYATEIYDGVSSQQNMEYRFDYDKPVHCQESSSCSSGEVSLQLEEDITRKAIEPKWSGWTDGSLSGVKRYAFEVWKMEYSLDYAVLREPVILSNYNPVPEFITEILASNNTFPKYEPKGPGVYSSILEVTDKANNSRYVRRIAIFDKTSEISIMSINRLFVLSASNQSNYTWQTTPNNLQTTMLIVQWEKHFINEVHENGHFLARVQDYTPRLSDDVKRVDYKEIESQFDDDEGNRTKDEISNINSIVGFEINHGTPNTDTPTHGWQNVLPLKENQSIVLNGVNIRDGDSYQVWVRATDVMGNKKIDSTVVHFDHSPPHVYSPTFEKNVDDGQFPFSSRITVTTKDEDSGISQVSIKFVVNLTGEVKNQKDFQVVSQTQTYCNQHIDCYCISQGECFMIDCVLDIDNCWLNVLIDEAEDEVYTLQISVYNLAMLSSMTTYILGTATSLSGIQVYYGVSNLQIEALSDTSFEVIWEESQSCYERLGMKLMVTNEDGHSQEHDVYMNATSYIVRNLKASSTYIINMFTKYGTDEYFVMSEPVNATINLSNRG